MALPAGVRSPDKSLQFLGARGSWGGIWWLSSVRVPRSYTRVVSCWVLICTHTLCFVFSVFIAKAGTQVVVPFRDEDEKRHLKVMGDLGQIVPLVRSVPSPMGPPVRPIDVCLLAGFNRNGT